MEGGPCPAILGHYFVGWFCILPFAVHVGSNGATSALRVRLQTKSLGESPEIFLLCFLLLAFVAGFSSRAGNAQEKSAHRPPVHDVITVVARLHGFVFSAAQRSVQLLEEGGAHDDEPKHQFLLADRAQS